MDFKAPAARQWMALTVPFIVGQSILALDEPIQRFFASSLPPASISWLNYGRRLMLVLPSILGQAAAVASFPLLSRQVEEGDVRGMRETLSRGLERAVLFAGLGAVGLIVLNREAVQIAFGRGAFTTLDVLTTGRVLAVFAPAVPALVAQAILARGYYALRDTWTPTLIGTAITLGSLPLYGFLARWFAEPGTDRGGGHLGLAWAGTLSLVAYGVLTAVVLERKLRRRDAGGKPLLAPAFLVRTTLVLAGTLVLAALGRGVVGGWLPEVALLPALGRSILVGTWLLACFFGLARLAGLSQATAPLGALAARRLR